MSESPVNQNLEKARVGLDYDGFVRPTGEQTEQRTVELLTQAANQDSVEARFLLGRYYHLRGDDTQGDKKLAVKWLLSAAKSACHRSATMLAFNFPDAIPDSLGMTCEAFLQNTYNRLLRDSKAGNVNAMYGLAGYLENGTGCQENSEQARSWYQKAADAGHLDAMTVVADEIMAMPEPDYDRVIQIVKKPAAAGDSSARTLLALANWEIECRDSIIAEIEQRESVLIVLDALRQGQSGPIATLGMKLLGKDIDQQKYGMQLIRMGAESADPVCCQLLGGLYFKGKVIPQDYSLARQWYERAVELGNLFPASTLARMYEAGVGVACSPEKADHYFELADTCEFTAIQKPDDQLSLEDKEDLFEMLIEIAEAGRIREVRKWVERYDWLFADPVFNDYSWYGLFVRWSPNQLITGCDPLEIEIAKVFRKAIKLARRA